SRAAGILARPSTAPSCAGLTRIGPGASAPRRARSACNGTPRGPRRLASAPASTAIDRQLYAGRRPPPGTSAPGLEPSGRLDEIARHLFEPGDRLGFSCPPATQQERRLVGAGIAVAFASVRAHRAPGTRARQGQ